MKEGSREGSWKVQGGSRARMFRVQTGEAVQQQGLCSAQRAQFLIFVLEISSCITRMFYFYDRIFHLYLEFSTYQGTWSLYWAKDPEDSKRSGQNVPKESRRSQNVPLRDWKALSTLPEPHPDHPLAAIKGGLFLGIFVPSYIIMDHKKELHIRNYQILDIRNQKLEIIYYKIY